MTRTSRMCVDPILKGRNILVLYSALTYRVGGQLLEKMPQYFMVEENSVCCFRMFQQVVSRGSKVLAHHKKLVVMVVRLQHHRKLDHRALKNNLKKLHHAVLKLHHVITKLHHIASKLALKVFHQNIPIHIQFERYCHKDSNDENGSGFGHTLQKI